MTETLIAFAVVALGVVLVPGPSNLFVLAHAIGHGRRSALAATAGIEIAALLRLAVVATGLSAILVSSPVAFAAIRWAGVGYLVYLGFQAWRERGRSGTSIAVASSVTTLQSARKGLIIGLSNPTMVIFYLALFPQFIDPARGSEVVQIVVLGLVMWVIGALWDTGFACASGFIGIWLDRRPGSRVAAGRVEGALYLGLAIWAGLTALG